MTFDDFVVGDRFSFGSHAVTREEVIAFATRYDPQDFHLDDEAAAKNPLFGRLSASGWHTASIGMRMTVDFWKENEVPSLGAPGVDELRWMRPVYPGDTLRGEAEVLAITPSKSKPDRGAVRFRTTLFNQDEEPVMRHDATVFIRRNNPA
jgi:acyl dehydratase